MDRNERRKENREYLKRINRCIRCQKQDAYTLIGRSYCFDCAAEMANRNKIYREWRKELNKEQGKAKRDYRRENGLCTCCGEKLPKNNFYIQCPTCRSEKRNEKRKRDRKKGANYPRGGNGICWQCNKEPVIEGHKLCKDCYEKKVRILENGPNRRAC